MTYTPTEHEKRVSAVVQALGALFLFVPSLVISQTQIGNRSPYVKYWSKVCLYWSLMTFIIGASVTVAAVILEIPAPAIVLAIVHVVFCITGALSSYFNTPFQYWFIAEKCCRDELGNVYGQLLSADQPTDSD